MERGAMYGSNLAGAWGNRTTLGEGQRNRTLGYEELRAEIQKNLIGKYLQEQALAQSASQFQQDLEFKRDQFEAQQSQLPFNMATGLLGGLGGAARGLLPFIP